MRLRELRIGGNRCLVLADCPRQIALAIECQTAREVRVRIVTKRTHLRQDADPVRQATVCRTRARGRARRGPPPAVRDCATRARASTTQRRTRGTAAQPRRIRHASWCWPRAMWTRPRPYLACGSAGGSPASAPNACSASSSAPDSSSASASFNRAGSAAGERARASLNSAAASCVVRQPFFDDARQIEPLEPSLECDARARTRPRRPPIAPTRGAASRGGPRRRASCGCARARPARVQSARVTPAERVEGELRERLGGGEGCGERDPADQGAHRAGAHNGHVSRIPQRARGRRRRHG